MTVPAPKPASGPRPSGDDDHDWPLFHVLDGVPTLTRVWIYTLLVTVYSAGVVWIEAAMLGGDVGHPSNIHGMMGLMLGVLLAFRTNGAYDRWWEGRKLWGALVNTCRNIAVKTAQLVELPEAERRDVARLVVAFPYALKEHLRTGAVLQKIPGCADDPATPRHVPGYLVARLDEHLRRWLAEGRIAPVALLAFDREVAQLLEQCGGCERIRNTRIARSYRRFVAQCISLYLLLLPWGLVEDFEIWTVPTVLFVAYFLIGIEVVAHAIEEPFGFDCDDLDLDGICRTIDVTVTDLVATPPSAPHAPRA